MPAYDRNVPFNSLPLLPPSDMNVDMLEVLKRTTGARAALGKLDGILHSVADPNMLINSIALREAKDSSEIENIFTTSDELYQSLAIETTSMAPAAREVLRYRDALRAGMDQLKKSGCINRDVVLTVYQALENTTQGLRPPTLQTVIRKTGSSLTGGKVVYTPPRGPGVLEKMLDNWEKFTQQAANTFPDPLIDLAVAHYQFEAIHPFSDGNGRTGRILNILYMIDRGLLTYPVLYLSGFIVKNKEDYYHFLGSITERKQWQPWVFFILDGIRQTCEFTIELIMRIQNLQTEFEKYVVSRLPKFNLEIIRLLFVQPYIRAVHIVNQPQCGIKSRQTATARLEELIDINLLSKKIVGRETVYINHQLLSILSK